MEIFDELIKLLHVTKQPVNRLEVGGGMTTRWRWRRIDRTDDDRLNAKVDEMVQILAKTYVQKTQS